MLREGWSSLPSVAPCLARGGVCYALCMAPGLEIAPSNESCWEAEDGVWRTIWGYAYADGEPRAVYYLRLNESTMREATAVVSLGGWVEGSSPSQRDCLACLARVHEGKLAFMLIDAETTSFGEQSVLGYFRRADEVRCTALAAEAFQILDQVLVQDARAASIRTGLEERAARRDRE